jgi:hypothetical protein
VRESRDSRLTPASPSGSRRTPGQVCEALFAGVTEGRQVIPTLGRVARTGLETPGQAQRGGLAQSVCEAVETDLMSPASEYYPHSTSTILETDKTHAFSLKTYGFCQVWFSPIGLKERAVESASFHPPRMLKLEEIQTMV